MNKKNGFTLVELLSIVAVLGIIVMLVFPSIGESIDSKKEKELEKIVNIVESAGKAYFSFNDDTYKIDVSTLTKEKYLTKELINPNTEEKLEGCVRKTLDNEDIFIYTYGSCNSIEVPLTVVLNGGTPSQEFKSIYEDSTKIVLLDPTHTTADFKGWQIVKGNSIIKGDTLIIGTEETILYANFEHYPKLTVNLDEGIDTIDYDEAYKSGTIIPLEKPTRAGYKFTGWIVTQGNSIISGNNLIMGSLDTIVKATWEEAVVQAIYSATDNSLTFINTKLQTKGGTYNGKEVTEVYTGIENKNYTTSSSVPWYSQRESIKKVEILDEISPISTYAWFYGQKNCNSINLNNLDTSKVTNMSNMFYQTGYSSTSFTLDLGNSFDTSQVTNMSNMFQDTGYSSTTFTLNLGNKFDTSQVTNMTQMFYYTGYSSADFTLDLGNSFDTSQVTNMSYMFSSTGYSSTSFTLDLGNSFDTSQVTDMSSMFSSTGYSSTSFTLDLGNSFDTSKVTNMSYMFQKTGYSNTSFTLDLGNSFDTSQVTDMSYMFYRTGYSSTNFTLDLGNSFDTSQVTNMTWMFCQTGYSSTTFTLNLGSSFDTSQVTNMNRMFLQTGYSSINFTLDLGNSFDTSQVTDMDLMFQDTGYSSTTFTLNLGNKFDTSQVTNMNQMFYQTGYSSTDFTLDLGNSFDTSKVTNMSDMFSSTGYSSTSFTLDLGNSFDTSQVTDMSSMFSSTGYSSTNFTLDLGDMFIFKDGVNTSSFVNTSRVKKLIIPSSVTNIPSGTFKGMSKLTEIVFEHSATDTITLPTAGSSTGAFYNNSKINTTVTTVNDTIKNYDWASDNRTVTFN